MAVALKVRSFKSYNDLTAFAAAPANNVNTIVSIQHDTTSGEWVLFFLS
jgi:hypothetical protein